MTFLGLSGLINFLTSIVMGVFVLCRNPRNIINRTYFYGNLAISLFSFGYFFWQLSHNYNLALFWFKFLTVGIILINVTFLHFVFAFIGILEKKGRELFLYYVINFIFISLNLNLKLYVSLEPRYNLGFWPIPTQWFFVYLIFWFWQCIYGFSWLLRTIKKNTGLKLEQIRYFTIATAIGFIGGATNWPMWYRIKLPPYGTILISAYVAIIAYAILRYRLMDIRVVLTRAGIFIFVYAFVLGLPLWLGFATNQWLWAVLLMGILSTIGPFMYSYLRQQVENVIFREQRRYQEALRGLAKRMIQIRELDALLKTVIHEVYKVVQPEFIALYTFSKSTKSFVFNTHSITNTYLFDKEISLTAPLVERLSKERRPLLTESAFALDVPFETLIVPYFLEGSLYGFMFMGPKPKKALYIESDFIAFDILSSQASLALENCIFWQDEKVRLAREEQIRRQRAMDHFSASMAHEIDNPIFAVTGMAEVVKVTVAKDLKDNLPQDKLTFLEDRLSRINKDLLRISKMIRSIREFSGQTKGEQVLLKLDDVLEGFLSIVEPQFKYEGIVFEKEIEAKIMLKGNKIHLEEVLVNLSTNAIHAVKHNHKKEKKITLEVYRKSPKTFLIEFKDNGYGIRRELLEDIFLDFVTTKASSEGTGMGLGRVRKIVENHGGRIWATSEGKDKGATFFVELPVA